MKLKFNYTKVEKFNIKQNGIQIIESGNKVEIYNDPFRTVPLFITKDINNQLIIFSNFEDYYTFDDIDKKIDEAGFWEIVLFGSGVWTRTLYANVEQMPAASKIIIDKIKGTYTIERYWDFNIVEDSSIDTIEKAAQGLYDRLDDIFSKLDRTQKYMMGMSGGMDSRITLAFLSKYIPKENLELFTYGFDEQLLEYTYACEVAEALGYNKPKFHKLTTQSYKNAMNYLPQMSGGQIGINHCHILDYLVSKDFNESIQVSNYISDAIFGLNTENNKNNKNSYITILNNNKSKIKKSVYDNILNDTEYILCNFNKKNNYTNITEYIYWSERTPKVFNYFSNLHSRHIKQELIYANKNLFNYMLSVPLKYRSEKKLIDYLLNNTFTRISSKKFKNISSMFQKVSRFSGFIEFYWFKFLNRANAILRPLTKGYMQLFNKYQTEEQDRLLHRDFHNELKNATSKFVKKGLMSEEQKQEWDKLPLKSRGVGERFTMIGLGELVE